MYIAHRRTGLGLVCIALAVSCSSNPEASEGPGGPASAGAAGALPAPASAPAQQPEPPADPVPSPGVAEEIGSPPLSSSPAPEAGDDGASGASPSDAGASLPGVTTGGSGGPVGPVELRSSGGLLYRINAPDGGGAHGLLVLLHGSTASNYEAFVPMMQDVAEGYGLIPVSVLAPNGQGWNEGNQVAAAELLHALVQEDLYSRYDIDTSRVLFSGQSSGGGFLASNFVPAHAADYVGGAFFQCGAAPPNIPFAPDALTRQRFRLHFEITTEDPIWPESYAATLVAYRNAQMQLTEDSTKPGGHCQFDQQGVILDHIDDVLGR